jgi:hypothetical protein
VGVVVVAAVVVDGVVDVADDIVLAIAGCLHSCIGTFPGAIKA